MADPAGLALAAASIIVAGVLVLVTYRLVRHTQKLADQTETLARHTESLARATEGLRDLEDRRDSAETRRRQITRLKRKIQLTQRVAAWNWEPWKHNYLALGRYPNPEGDELRELATLIEYGKDHANRELVEGLVRVLDILVQGEPIVGVPADNFVANASHLMKLIPDIQRWERELMELAVEDTK